MTQKVQVIFQWRSPLISPFGLIRSTRGKQADLLLMLHQSACAQSLCSVVFLPSACEMLSMNENSLFHSLVELPFLLFVLSFSNCLRYRAFTFHVSHIPSFPRCAVVYFQIDNRLAGHSLTICVPFIMMGFGAAHTNFMSDPVPKQSNKVNDLGDIPPRANFLR